VLRPRGCQQFSDCRSESGGRPTGWIELNQSRGMARIAPSYGASASTGFNRDQTAQPLRSLGWKVLCVSNEIFDQVSQLPVRVSSFGWVLVRCKYR
jgi:hypothetical protein